MAFTINEERYDEPRSEFNTQKTAELRKLQRELAELGPGANTVKNIKFLGCIMESVRSFLAHSVQSWSDLTQISWDVRNVFEIVPILCSDQLNDALKETVSVLNGGSETATDKAQSNSLHMRILWEIQLNLINSDTKHPSSTALMILCMLGFPSLRVSNVAPGICRERYRDVLGDVDIPVGPSDASEDTHVVIPVGRSDASEDAQYELCYKIDVVHAPQNLHVVFGWHCSSRKGQVQICSDEGHPVTSFHWQSWKDAFMGRLCAQVEWRSTRIYLRNERIREEAALSLLNDGISQTSKSASAITYWQGWPPFRSQIAGFERHVSSVYFSSPEDLDEEFDLAAGIRHLKDSEGGRGSTVAPSSCGRGCEVHNMYLEAKELWKNGLEKKAFELFGLCIKEHGHLLALEHYVSYVADNFAENKEILRLLMHYISAGMERVYVEDIEKNCEKFERCHERYNLEKLIDQFGKVYEASKYHRALQLKMLALVLASQGANIPDDRCIETSEAYLMLEDSRTYDVTLSRFCLALCFFRRYCSTGHCEDEEIGIQHFMGLSSYNDRLAMDVAFLIEKGWLSRREYARVEVLPTEFSESLPKGIDLEAMLKSIFRWSSDDAFRISRNAKVASTIYSRIVNENGFIWTAQRRAANRLAMMFHRGTGDLPKDVAKAEELYTKIIEDDEQSTSHVRRRKDVHSINAICNLAVLIADYARGETSLQLFKKAIDELERKGKRDEEIRRHRQSSDAEESARKSSQMLEEIIDDVAGHEKRYNEVISDDKPLEKHSSSMNNLAVIIESGELAKKDIEEAKRLYLRSIEIDENPVAMYNLAVLLKFEDPTPHNLKQAESLLCAVNDLGVDLQSTPVLATQMAAVRTFAVSEISKAFRFEVEEIDDCLAYVKVLDR